VGKISVGIIGLGVQGELHLAACREVDTIRVAAVCDVRGERLAAVADRYGVQDRYEECSALLQREDIALVIVATRESDRFVPALRALQAGKHVLMDVPVATNPFAADALRRAAIAAGKHLFVGASHRQEERYADVYAAIRDGHIGQLTGITLRYDRAACVKSYGRAPSLFERYARELDLMLWYAGCRAVRMKAYADPAVTNNRQSAETRAPVSLDAPHIAKVTLRFASGASGLLIDRGESTCAADEAAEVSVSGTEGTVRAGFQQAAQQSAAAFTALRKELDRVSGSLLRGDAPDYAQWRHTVHAAELIDGIVRSAAFGYEINY